MNLGFGEIAIILFVTFLFFGPNKLPDLGKAAGVSLREFKQAVSGLMEGEDKNHSGEKSITQDM
ncbi:MAG: twin-arginine translocase TatA/TatE family subunit [Bacillota bacterium]